MDITTLEHFDRVEIPVAANRECVDILIGESENSLLTVLEQREVKNPHQPNFVLTRLGPVASGGRVPCGSDNFSSRKVSIDCATVECEVGKKGCRCVWVYQKAKKQDLELAG